MCIYYIANNRAIRPCHPSHFMPLVLILPRGDHDSVCECMFLHINRSGFNHTHYCSSQQRYKPRHNPCQVQPSHNRELIRVKTMPLDTNYSFYCLQSPASITQSELQAIEKTACLVSHPSTKAINSDSKLSWLSEGQTNTSYATLYKQLYRPMSKHFHSIILYIYTSRASPIDSQCCRPPMASALNHKQSGMSRSSQF